MSKGDRLFPRPSKLRKDRAHSVGQSDLPILDKEHDRTRRGDDLCERGEIKHRVERHRLRRRLKGPHPIRLAVDRMIATTHPDNRTRYLTECYRLLDHRIRLIGPGGARRRRTAHKGQAAGQGACQDNPHGVPARFRENSSSNAGMTTLP